MGRDGSHFFGFTMHQCPLGGGGNRLQLCQSCPKTGQSSTKIRGQGLKTKTALQKQIRMVGETLGLVCVLVFLTRTVQKKMMGVFHSNPHGGGERGFCGKKQGRLGNSRTKKGSDQTKQIRGGEKVRGAAASFGTGCVVGTGKKTRGKLKRTEPGSVAQKKKGGHCANIEPGGYQEREEGGVERGEKKERRGVFTLEKSSRVWEELLEAEAGVKGGP